MYRETESDMYGAIWLRSKHFPAALCETAERVEADKRLIAIRSYELHPGCQEVFHRIMRHSVVPLLQDLGIEVIAFGPVSPYFNSYQLVCVHRDLHHLRDQQAAAYGSERWRNGPREAFFQMLKGYQDAHFFLSECSVEDLRQCNAFGMFNL